MATFQDGIWWVGGFFILTILCIVIILLRNKAAKTDRVRRSEKDTVINSVSLEPEKKTTKLG